MGIASTRYLYIDVHSDVASNAEDDPSKAICTFQRRKRSSGTFFKYRKYIPPFLMPPSGKDGDRDKFYYVVMK